MSFSGPGCVSIEFEVVSPTSWVGWGDSSVVWAAAVGLTFDVFLPRVWGAFAVRRGGTSGYKEGGVGRLKVGEFLFIIRGSPSRGGGGFWCGESILYSDFE